MSKSRPRIILGTMTIGGQMNRDQGDTMVQRFLEAGNSELDTAYVYVKGKTEELLGDILSKVSRDRYNIATKANPDVEGHFRAETVIKQLDTSLSRLREEYVDILYLHQPHPATPIEDTLDGCTRLYRDGKFRELGLSNFTSWETAHIWHLCEARDLPKPTVYQGMYNAITRDVERELFPCLRTLGIRFYAFNPLAGGLLTGKHRGIENIPDAGRFHQENYRDRYWKAEYFEGISTIAKACGEAGIPAAEAALRWAAYHSLLDGDAGDGVIIGASSLEHLASNLAAFEQPDLPAAVVKAYDDAWEMARYVCPKYFRP